MIWAIKVLITPLWILSWIKWQSTSIFFDHSWKTGFIAMWMATWLSQNNIAGLSWEISKSFKKLFSQTMSHVCGSQRYSASTKELDKVPISLISKKPKYFPNKYRSQLRILYLANLPSLNPRNSLCANLSYLERKHLY